MNLRQRHLQVTPSSKAKEKAQGAEVVNPLGFDVGAVLAGVGTSAQAASNIQKIVNSDLAANAGGKGATADSTVPPAVPAATGTQVTVDGQPVQMPNVPPSWIAGNQAAPEEPPPGVMAAGVPGGDAGIGGICLQMRREPSLVQLGFGPKCTRKSLQK